MKDSRGFFPLAIFHIPAEAVKIKCILLVYFLTLEICVIATRRSENFIKSILETILGHWDYSPGPTNYMKPLTPVVSNIFYCCASLMSQCHKIILLLCMQAAWNAVILCKLDVFLAVRIRRSL